MPYLLTYFLTHLFTYTGGDVSVLNLPASYVTFEVSFGIGVKNDGQVIYLRNIEGCLHSFIHSLTHSLTYLLTHSLTHSLTYLLTYLQLY